MSWETREMQPGSGSLRPGYTVEEPKTPAYESGIRFPAGGDEELLQLMESWTGETSQMVARSFEDRGDDLLESFLERHVSDLPDGGQQLRALLNSAEGFSERVTEEGDLAGTPQVLSYLLTTKVVPIVKDVIRASNRQKAAHGRRDHVPGEASVSQERQIEYDRTATKHRIDADIRRMEEYQRYQEFQSEAARGHLIPENQLRMHTAHKDILTRELYYWNEENKTHGGVFGRTIGRLRRELDQTHKALDHVHKTVAGLGYAQAQKQIDQRYGPADEVRPWAGERMHLRTDKDTPGGPGVWRPWVGDPRGAHLRKRPKEEAKYPEEEKLDMRDAADALKRIKAAATVHYKRNVAKASLDALEAAFRKDVRILQQTVPDIAGDVRKIWEQSPREDYLIRQLVSRLNLTASIVSSRAAKADARRQASRSASAQLRLRGGVGSRSSSAEDYIPGPGRGSASRSPGRSPSGMMDPDYRSTSEDSFYSTVSYSPLSGTRAAPIELDPVKEEPEVYQGKPMKHWEEIFAQHVPQIVGQNRAGPHAQLEQTRLSYVLPQKAEPVIYKIAYGVKAAADVVELFDVYHRQVNAKDSVRALIQVMSKDPSMGLNKPVPGNILGEMRNKKGLEGLTLKQILTKKIQKKGRKTNVQFGQGMSENHAYQLLGKGHPGKTPGAGKKDVMELRMHAVEPAGFLVELYNQWRRSGAAAELGFEDTNVLQLLSYHRARRTHSGASRSRSANIARVPEQFSKYWAGKTRQQLSSLSRLFGHRSGQTPFSRDFWTKSPREQVKFMTRGKGRGKWATQSYASKKWAEVLLDVFDYNVEEELGIEAEAAHDRDEKGMIWEQLRNKMIEFTTDMGISPAAAGDHITNLLSGAQAPSRSPTPGHRVRKRATALTPKSPRPRTRAQKRKAAAEEEPGDEEEEELDLTGGPPKKKRAKRLTEADRLAVDALGIPALPAPGSYKPGPPGSHLFEGWDEALGSSESARNRLTVSRAKERNIFFQLKQLRDRRLKPFGPAKQKVPSAFSLYPNLPHQGARRKTTTADWDSFRIRMDKAAWNLYVTGLGPWLERKRKDKTVPERHTRMFRRGVSSEEFLFSEVFRPEDEEAATVLLRKWAAARIYNYNVGEGRSKLEEAHLDVRKNWMDQYDSLAVNYKALEAQFKKAKKDFPIPDWEERLYDGNQFDGLSDLYHTGKLQKMQPYPKYAGPVAARVPEHVFDRDAEEKDDIPEITPKHGPRIMRPIRPRQARPPQKRKPGPKPEREPAASPIRVPRAVDARSRSREPQDVPVLPQEEEKGPPPERGLPALRRASGRAWSAPGGLGRVHPAHEQPAPFDVLQALAEDEEQAIRDLDIPGRFLPVRPHNDKLRAEVVQQQNYEALNGVHLLQTDHGFSQPVMGTVHLVRAAPAASDKHFMHDVDGDINEGQKVLVERAKRGPFRGQSGRSTVMDSSAHVIYRKRAGAMEITVKRGVVGAEVRQMMSKLTMHRMSAFGSHVVLIKGTKRFRLGPLAEINLKYLKQLVYECLQQYGSCGLEITQSRAGQGALYKPGVHGARFKNAARRGTGPAAVRR